MERPTAQLRTLAFAVMAAGALLDVLGILRLMRGSLPVAIALLAFGSVLTGLGAVLLARGRR